MRGKPDGVFVEQISPRNIPAYAGKTVAHFFATQVGAEHPRVCGENLPNIGQAFLNTGTSPRMRGKPAQTWGPGCSGRNIPAYAGKTMYDLWAQKTDSEHPRVCGEN